MAEIERIANHLGDFGAICNDAAFALLHAHTGAWRERTLRAAAATFGHRMMMDCVARPAAPRSISRPRRQSDPGACRERSRAGVLKRLIELYDNTASLLDRTTAGPASYEARACDAVGGGRS